MIHAATVAFERSKESGVGTEFGFRFGRELANLGGFALAGEGKTPGVEADGGACLAISLGSGSKAETG